MNRVLIPSAPGNLSAMGLLSADVRHDLVRTMVTDASTISGEKIQALFRELLAEAEEVLERDGVKPGSRECFVALDLRYQGQNYELTIPVNFERLADSNPSDGMIESFHEQHQKVYGYSLPGRVVQIVNLRVTAVGSVEKAQWPSHPDCSGALPVHSTRSVVTGDGKRRELAVYRIDDMGDGASFEGPAVVEYPGSTLFVEPGWHARFDAMRNAHLTRFTSENKA